MAGMPGKARQHSNAERSVLDYAKYATLKEIQITISTHSSYSSSIEQSRVEFLKINYVLAGFEGVDIL
ncbi:hypothetical protein AJ78_04449 [Emergomyces pasteurianus Ep9510]|uniref:Uncharacterized protein n=1 Tax=Emergomyces pasteurianus Ep9510 TaxID=1447872 RepID=A0A1J9QHA3_9EURO|nr:hypothetical protein AJ78_04449 [Emergomyces pasteurianus Ep9510]